MLLLIIIKRKKKKADQTYQRVAPGTIYRHNELNMYFFLEIISEMHVSCLDQR